MDVWFKKMPVEDRRAYALEKAIESARGCGGIHAGMIVEDAAKFLRFIEGTAEEAKEPGENTTDPGRPVPPHGSGP